MAKKKNKLKPAGSTSAKKSAAKSSNSELPPTGASAPLLMKICRLCEVKDGPFLNIFDSETNIAKKLDSLLPFTVTENDELPLKICFRCSAKVEELHDFLQKCIKTQESLYLLVGKKSTLTLKSKTRMVWEEKLTQSNISNDEICDAVIQKAMAGIKDLPPLPLEEALVKKRPTNVVEEVPTKKTKLEVEETSVRVTRNKSEVTLQSLNKDNIAPELESRLEEDTKTLLAKEKSNKLETKPESDKPFDIMDFVSIIKVNGVGVLFQCHKCNRNFLNKDIVMSHSCAKSGCPPVEPIPTAIPIPHPLKDPMSTIKFINSKPSTETSANSVPEKKKPKIGPASKVKKMSNDVPVIGMKVSPREPTPPLEVTIMSIPISINKPPGPSLQTTSKKPSFKLVPGPNNTFTLLEDASKQAPPPAAATPKKITNKPGPKSRKAPTLNTINIDDDDPPQPVTKPYPVGLFHAIGSQPIKEPVPFTTPAMKKQSYTIVQTGNPSKLLISTKAQDGESHKRSKDKTEATEQGGDFVTLVNFDSTQPSFVLPGQNSIIQESQISTSTPAAAGGSKGKDTYACSLCPESFSREKKLLAHVQNHYDKMDEETDEKVRSKRKTRNT